MFLIRAGRLTLNLDGLCLAQDLAADGGLRLVLAGAPDVELPPGPEADALRAWLAVHATTVPALSAGPGA